MGSAKAQGQIKVPVSSKSFERPVEPPMKQKKKIASRVQDIGESIFQTKKVDKDTADRILNLYENERAKNARIENETIDLKCIIDNFKEKEKSLYFKFYPFWELAYYSNPTKTIDVANDFKVNPDNSEYRQNIHDLGSIVDAYLKVVHFTEPDKDGFRTLYKMEQSKRTECERKLAEATEEIEGLKKEIERVKSQKITVSGVALKPVEVIYEEMEKSDNHKKENIHFEVNNQPMKEKSETPVEKYEIEDSLFVNILKEKGYTVHQSTNPHHDAVIEYNNEQIPICFIDYPIEKPEKFDQIMESTNKIFFLFDNNENFQKGNGRFSRWLLFSDRKKEIRFSLTMFDDLQKSGKLNIL